jgi:WD40 repeat protein
VYVGTLDDPPNKQFYTLQMSETGPMTLLDSLGMSGSVLDISLRDGYAYAATAYNAGELQVADIFDPEHLAFAPGGGLDITDVQDANAMLTSGSAAIIGRTNGSTISELTMYTVADAPVPAPPPGPWTWEIGGDVLSLSNIYGSTYLFVCGSASSAQIRVLDTLKLEHNQSPVVQTYNASATVKGSFYDWQKDRFYAVTASNLMVFSPG